MGLVYSAADPRRPEATVASLAQGELRLQIAARSTGLVMAWVRGITLRFAVQQLGLQGGGGAGHRATAGA